jgi:hypothetical protein
MVDCMVLIFDIPNRANLGLTFETCFISLNSHITFISPGTWTNVLTITHHPIVLYI